ncbi:MAG: zinc-binding alcohol dehydrogenase [Verrucomicrobia bacterium]|nr:zinc-binding alcohol dehydrogenase [Verrucomicrobiota bacterium]MDA1088230.1 zinc-binding alcohol dehydrogenase [Verrucomicrobiota bacterium]
MRYYAISITAKEHAEVVEVAAPEALGPNEVRGRTLFTLVSPGTELAMNYTGASFPSFPGYAATFEAEELGAEVKDISVGDVCFCMGPHRSFQQVDAQAALPVPGGLPPEEAVLARLMGVSMTTLMTTTARPGDRVMVTGAGPVGFLAAQMFTLSGYEVFVVEPNEGRRHLVEQSGIRTVYEKMPFDDSSVAGTVALVVECSGHEQAVLDACRVVRKRGEVVLVGVPWRRQTNASAHDVLSLVFHKYVVLRSGWEWELPHHAADFAPHSIHSGFDKALRWLAAGHISIDNMITKANPLAPQNVYQDLLHRRTKGLFSVFDWGQTETPDTTDG